MLENINILFEEIGG